MARDNATFNMHKHTVHTIEVSLPAGSLAGIEERDELQIIVNGVTSPKKMTYRDLVRLLEGDKASSGY